MINHFLRLFEYDQYANRKLLQVFLQAGSPEKAGRLMAHVLSAQQIWLRRCQLLPNNGQAVWPEEWQPERFEGIITDNYESWKSYLHTLTADQLEENISYRSSQGSPFNNTRIDILSHVINHGTHHRAQIGQLLKQNGITELPISDYIFFTR